MWKRGLKAFIRNKTGLILGLFIGIKFTSWITPLWVLLAMISVEIVFYGVGLYLATIVRSGQTFQIVKTAVTMPLTFISGAYIPLSILPDSLRYVAYLNPMTYVLLNILDIMGVCYNSFIN